MHNVNWKIMSIHLNNKARAPSFGPMPMHTPRHLPTRSPHTPIPRTAGAPAKAMVAVIAGSDAPLVATAYDLPRWRRLTPLAVWSTVPVRDGSREQILRGVAAELARQAVQARQMILLAEGESGRAALEMVLQGGLDCAGILAIAVSCAALPFPIVPTTVAVRLVVQREECADAPDNLISTLRTADIDARIIRLDPAASQDTRIATNAAETFVLELVANASRQGRHGV
jgi:hypothetical protein